MSRTSILLASVALATTGSVFASEGVTTEGKLTLAAKVTQAGEPTITQTGQRQSLVSTRFGNREVLQLLVENDLIESVTGYTLIERFYGNMEHHTYVAVNTTTQSEVAVPSEIMELIETTDVQAITYNEATGKGGVKAKSFSTLAIEDASASLLENWTITYGTVTFDSEPYEYAAISIKGRLQGNLGFDEQGPIIEGNVSVAKSKPVSLPN